jgi:hypothetical protein
MGVRRRLARWALIALAIPVTAKLADGLARRVEASRGPNSSSRRLRAIAARLRDLQGRRPRRGLGGRRAAG